MPGLSLAINENIGGLLAGQRSNGYVSRMKWEFEGEEHEFVALSTLRHDPTLRKGIIPECENLAFRGCAALSHHLSAVHVLVFREQGISVPLTGRDKGAWRAQLWLFVISLYAQ
jgi:hypothetical protein